MAEKPNGAVVAVSKFISGFFNPLVSILIFFIWKEIHFDGVSGILNRFLPGLLILLFPISLWIFWNVKTGRYTNFDVSNRRQRQSLYVFIEIVLAIFIILNRFFLTGIWDWDFIFMLILLVVMQVSNFFIKSSMHTAFNIFVAGLFYIHGAENWVWIGWILLSVLVGITRIILKKHTPKEVLIGAVLGSLICLGMYFFREL